MPDIKRSGIVVVAVSCIVILVMMVFYPAGYDQHAFSVGGQLVRNGEIPYRDFLDTKPPIIFYIYATASAIFGDHDSSIRILDALYHILAIGLFYKLLRKYDLSQTLSIVSVAIYTMIYVGAGYWMTAQAETFAFIPILLALGSALAFERSGTSPIKRGLVVGTWSIVLFLLKYTLLVIPAGIVLWLFARRGPRMKAKVAFTLASVGAFVAGLALYIVYLSAVHGLDFWFESLTWLSGYSSIEPLLSPQVAIDRYLKLFQIVSGEVFTFLIIACCAVGLYARYTIKGSDRFNALISLMLIQLGIGIVATIYERKFFNYHFLKFLWALAPFAAIGLVEVWGRIRQSWQNSPNLLKRGLLACVVGAFLFYSPAMSLRQPLRWTYYRLAGVDEADILDNNGGNLPLKEMRMVAGQLKPMLGTSDEVFFWGNHVGIFSMIGKLPATISLTNTPLSTDWTPQTWKDKLYGQLTTAPPQYMIIEKRDLYPFINGSDLDSRTRWFADERLRSFTETNYDSLFGTSRFDVYKKR